MLLVNNVENNKQDYPTRLYKMIDSPIGEWLLGASSKGIVRLDHINRICVSDYVPYSLDNHYQEHGIQLINEHLSKAEDQLQLYFSYQLKQFSLKLDVKGTEFQQRVWKQLIAIPFGDTRNYQQIANNVGNMKACRAVGSANRINPISIIIPCHRVIGKNGKLTGYANGLDIKDFLLSFEAPNN